MGTFSALPALCAGNWPVTGEFSTQRPVTRSFDVLFDLPPNKHFGKQSRRQWFETLSRSLWRHCNHLPGHIPCQQEGCAETLNSFRWYTYVGYSTHCGGLVEHYILMALIYNLMFSLQWRHNGRDSVTNHQPHDCLLNRLFTHRSKKNSKLRVTGLCAWNAPVTGEFPAQMTSNAENVSIWWRHHVF